jgi:hypothetical protein
MPKPKPIAREDLFTGLAGGVSVAVAGPPGTGKSTLLGSAGRLGNAKLLATKPREANSWLYRETGIAQTAELFHDPLWRPAADSWEANGFVNLIKRLWELHDDKDLDFILVDPFTDIVALAAHEILKVEKVATPRESRDSQGFYGSLKHRLKEVTQAITALQFAPKPKHVLVAVHTMPAKDDTVLPRSQGGGVKESQDNRAAGIEYEGTVLPMIEGGYRREFTGEFDIVVYSDIIHERTFVAGKGAVENQKYVIQVLPDKERHAKTVLGPIVAEKYIDNDFATLLNAIRGN